MTKVVDVLQALRTYLETSVDTRALREVAKVVITAAVPEMEDLMEWLHPHLRRGEARAGHRPIGGRP